jgi:hypothetical protein
MILNYDSNKAPLDEMIEKEKTRTAEKNRRMANQYKEYFEIFFASESERNLLMANIILKILA